MTTNNQMTAERFEDVVIFTLGTLDELVRKGLVCRTDGSAKLGSSGMIRFYELKAAGFTCTEGELQTATMLFMRFVHSEDEDETCPE